MSVKAMNPINLADMGYKGNISYKHDVKCNYDDNDLYKKYPQMFSVLTDVSAVEMFVNVFDNFTIFDNKVYKFNGVYWCQVLQQEITNSSKIICSDFSRNLHGNADGIHPETMKVIEKNLIKLGNISTLTTMCKAITNIIEVKENPFDVNPNLIGFENGVYDLLTGEFRNGCKSDYVTLSTGYGYTDDVDTTEIMNWLDVVMPNEDERDLLLHVLSSGLHGKSTPYFTILTGSGRNGKDTLVTLFLKKALGNYYYRSNNSAITDDVKGDLNVSIASMHKKRCVVFNEPSKLKTIKTSMIKELTGCANVSFRMPYSTNTNIDLSCSMLMLCNDKPKLDSVDAAIAARLIIIPFRTSFRTKEYVVENGLEFGKESNIYECDDRKYEDEDVVNSFRVPQYVGLLGLFSFLLWGSLDSIY